MTEGEHPTIPSSTPEKIIMSTKSPSDAAFVALPPTVSSSTTGPAPAVGKFLGSKKTVSLSGIGVTFTRAHRASMSVRDKGRIYENATSVLEPKFAMIDLSSDLTSDDFLQKNHDFIVQLARLQNHITAYCMGDVFQIIATKGVQGDWEPIGSTMTDLFKNYQTLTFDQVIESNRGYLYWSSDDVSGENLMWSQELILNSVDDDLYDRINSKILNLPEDARGGPMALYFLTDLILKTTDRTARILITRLSEFQLSSIPDEDIDIFQAIVQSMMLRLKASTMGVPSDFHSLLYDIIVRSCSVFALRNHLTILHTMDDARLSTPQGILQEACHMMHKLISEKRWLPQSKKGSSCNTMIVESGPLGPATVFIKPLKDRKGDPIDRSPPGSHHPQSRVTENSITEHWCNHDKCGRWGNHLTSGYEAWYSEFKARRAARRPPKAPPGQASAHQAAGTPSPSPQPSSVSTPIPTHKPYDRRIRFPDDEDGLGPGF
jgi:hypothetical protein